MFGRGAMTDPHRRPLAMAQYLAAQIPIVRNHLDNIVYRASKAECRVLALNASTALAKDLPRAGAVQARSRIRAPTRRVVIPANNVLHRMAAATRVRATGWARAKLPFRFAPPQRRAAAHPATPSALAIATTSSASAGTGPSASRSSDACAKEAIVDCCLALPSTATACSGLANRMEGNVLSPVRGPRQIGRIVAFFTFGAPMLVARCGGRAPLPTDVRMDAFGGGDTSSEDEATGSSDRTPDSSDSPDDSCGTGGRTGGEGASAGLRPCSPLDAMGTPPSGFSSSECHDVFGWGWDGGKCIAIVGCSCLGADCGNLLPVQSACSSAYAHCP
jgi:hypothetical protein